MCYTPSRRSFFHCKPEVGGGGDEPRVVPKDARTGVSDRRGVLFTMVQQRDGNGHRARRVRVGLCAGSEGNETM